MNYQYNLYIYKFIYFTNFLHAIYLIIILTLITRDYFEYKFI